MAGHVAPRLAAEQEQEQALAHSSAGELLRLSFASPGTATEPAVAYGLVKRANHLRIQAASVLWGERGARLNSISPGTISTPMARQELASEFGPAMRGMIDGSAVGRLGKPEDIAAAAAFLLGPDSTFITGTDLLGGGVAAVRADSLAEATRSCSRPGIDRPSVCLARHGLVGAPFGRDAQAIQQRGDNRAHGPSGGITILRVGDHHHRFVQGGDDQVHQLPHWHRTDSTD